MATESTAAAACAALRVAAAGAEAALASARAGAAAAEAAAAAARAIVDASVADAQAAAVAMCTHPFHAFYGSAHFSLLDASGSLHLVFRLITDAVHEDDVLCLALTCCALRDALSGRAFRRGWLATRTRARGCGRGTRR